MASSHKAKNPIESFGPELMALLIKGSKERVVVELSTTSEARNLQARIHALRARMRQHEHLLYPVVARARCSVLWGEAATTKIGRPGHFLLVQPNDIQYTDALKRAGVDISSAEPPKPLAPSTPAGDGQVDLAHDPLDDLK